MEWSLSDAVILDRYLSLDKIGVGIRVYTL